MKTYRRKSDQMLSVIPGHPDEVLAMLIEMHKKLETYKKEGYRIAVFKERVASCVYKTIDI